MNIPKVYSRNAAAQTLRGSRCWASLTTAVHKLHSGSFMIVCRYIQTQIHMLNFTSPQAHLKDYKLNLKSTRATFAQMLCRKDMWENQISSAHLPTIAIAMQRKNKSHETKDDNLHLSAVEHGLSQIDGHTALATTGCKVTKCGMTARQTELSTIGQVSRRANLPPAERPVLLRSPVASSAVHSAMNRKLITRNSNSVEILYDSQNNWWKQASEYFRFRNTAIVVLVQLTKVKMFFPWFYACYQTHWQRLYLTDASVGNCCCTTECAAGVIRAVWSWTMSCCMQHTYLHRWCAIQQRRCIVILPLILSPLFELWLFLMYFDHT